MSDLPQPLERLRGTIGLWTMYFEALGPSQSAELAVELEELGYPAVWIPEAWGREAFTNASLLLRDTSKMIVATGIANMWARDAVTMSNAAKTLSAVSNDRFILGLGVSHEPLVARLRGHDYVSPVNAMQEYLSAMDAAPMFAPEGQTRVPRVIAALGPKMLDIAAASCDGAHPYLTTPEHTAIAREHLGDKFVGVEQGVVLGQDREEFLRRAHEYLEIYTGLLNYTNNWKRLGFDESDFVRGGSERLCDAMVLHGDEDTIREGVKAHQDAGADHVCLQVLGQDLATPPLAEWRALASMVAS